MPPVPLETVLDTELERILADDYLAQLTTLSVAELRALRLECQGVETQLSYLRRLVQGRHDIVASEIDRRAGGGDRDDVAGLVDRLPQILSDRIHAPGPGRLPSDLEPSEPTGELADRLAEISQQIPLESPVDVDDATLVQVGEQLSDLERDVSALRRRLFNRIDDLQSEITGRYRRGEASVEELLGGAT